MPKYLLPCACGNQIPIEPTDAGLTVACTCGAKVKVPSTRSIFALPRLSGEAADHASRSSTGWGLRNQLLTAGLVCLLLGGIWTGYLVYTKPVNPVEEMAEIDIQRMPVNLLVAVWGSFQDGFEPIDTQRVADYMVERDDNLRLTRVSSAVIAGGVALLAFALLAGGQRRPA